MHESTDSLNALIAVLRRNAADDVEFARTTFSKPSLRLRMGHNPTKNPFRRARLGLDVGTQAAVDEYKARSVWSAWWQLDDAVRRRYFTRDERDFITKYGARLDEIACHVTMPRTDAERHFLSVCMGDSEPATDRERLWLHVHLVCRYQRAENRAARVDLAEHQAAALQAENRALRAKSDHLEAYVVRLGIELQLATGELTPSICNVVYASMRCRGPAIVGPPAYRSVIMIERRGVPLRLSTTYAVH